MQECNAVVVDRPRHASVQRVPITPADRLGDHEVLVHSQLSLLSPGTELARYRGSVVPATGQDSRAHFPFHPGYATVGTVVAAGPASGQQTGDRVLVHSPHQDRVVVDTRHTLCLTVPSGVADRAVPFARLAQVGAVSLALCASPPGSPLAVVGLGLVGNLAGQLASSLGYRVRGVDPSVARRRLAAACGLDCVESSAQLPGGDDAPAVVLECSGAPAAVLGALAAVATCGEVFLVGAPWSGAADIPSAPLLATIFDRFSALRSGWEWQLPIRRDGHIRRHSRGDGAPPAGARVPAGRPGSIEECTEEILLAMAGGSIRTDSLVTDVVRPEEVDIAYRQLDEDPEHHLGVLVDWS